jgi:hypothetical protein
MRKWLMLLPVVVLAVIALSGAGTSGATPNSGADIYGVGGGSQDLGTGTKIYKFAFSVHTGPNGDFGSSHFTFEDPNFPLDVTVDIDCVNVQPFPPGNGVWFGGTVTKVSPQPNLYGVMLGDEEAFHANDFGNPSGLIPDEYQAYIHGYLQQACKFQGSYPEAPISQGNITIKTG